MPSAAVPGTAKTLERLWQECQAESVEIVARRHNLTRQSLVALFQQSGLIGGGNRDPSQREIRQACRALQKRWTADQAEARWVGRRSIAVLRED